jgi:hypothetical protein
MRARGISPMLVAICGVTALHACGGASGGVRPGSTLTTSSGGAGAASSDGTSTELGSVLTCGGAPALFATESGLPVVAALPDPFRTMDGPRITRQDQWSCRRAEIAAQAQVYELLALDHPVGGGRMVIRAPMADDLALALAALGLPTHLDDELESAVPA